MIENSVVTLPYEETKDGRSNKWDVAYLHDEKRGTMFTDAIVHLETQILRGLLVPERVVTQDISTGSYSMAATHAEAFLLSQEGLTTAMEDAVNEQLIPPLVEFNFKPKSRISCKLHIEGLQHDRKRLLKELFIEMVRNLGTFARQGVVPSALPNLVEMADILKIPMNIVQDMFAGLGEIGGVVSGNGGTAPSKPEGTKKDVEELGKQKGGQQEAARANVIPIKKKAANVSREPVIV
jgi:hypothetical protein